MPESKKENKSKSNNKKKKKTTKKKVEDSSALTIVENNPITIKSSKESIVEKIFETDNVDELKDLTNLFGISLTKKEIARASTESDLLDRLLDIARERITSKGEYLSHEEILDYIKTFQGNVDKSKKTLNDELDRASVNVSNNKTEVNINVNTGVELSRESRERVLDVVNAILKQNADKQTTYVVEEEDNHD